MKLLHWIRKYDMMLVDRTYFDYKGNREEANVYLNIQEVRDWLIENRMEIKILHNAVMNAAADVQNLSDVHPEVVMFTEPYIRKDTGLRLRHTSRGMLARGTNELYVFEGNLILIVTPGRVMLKQAHDEEGYEWEVILD